MNQAQQIATGGVAACSALKSPTTVAVVLDSWNYPFNGTVVSTRRFVKGLVERGYRVRVIAMEGAETDLPGVEIYHLPKLNVLWLNGLIAHMQAYLSRPKHNVIAEALEGVSILHVQWPFFAGAAAIKEAKRHNIPVLCSFHVQAENLMANLHLPPRLFGPLIYGIFRRWIYDRSDRVIAPSAFARDELRRAGVTVPITVLSNGVPEAQLAAFRLRAAVGRPLKILCVGRLAVEKRQDTIVAALGLSAHRQYFDVTFVGSGPQENVLRQQCLALGLQATFIKPSDEELDTLYAKADVFLHAGESELEGMSVMQAMAAGVPTLVSDSHLSAARELACNDSSRFRAGDAAHLAQQLDTLIDQPERAQSMSRDNHERMTQFSHNQSLEGLMAIYHELLGSEDG